MKFIRENTFASERDMFSFVRLIRSGRKNARCGFCLLCAFVIAFSCINIPSVKINATAEEYLEQSFEIYPDEKSSEKYITLNGIMPENAFAEAVDVTEEYSVMEELYASDGSAEETEVLAAYDISITGKKGEFQPEEGRPVFVEIVDPKICPSRFTRLLHIADDGTCEQIYDFTIRDGKLSFYAEGFSVYAIINAPDPYVYPDMEQVTSVRELTGSRADSGFYLFLNQTNSPANNRYVSSDINSLNCLIETSSLSDAAVWYFEPDINGNKMYTYVNGEKKYLHNIHSKNGVGTSVTTDWTDIELSDTDADFFDITFNSEDNSFFLKKSGSTMYIQHSKSGGGIRYFDGNGDKNNTHIKMLYADTVDPPSDMYNFNGRSYGLMQYQGGTLGYGLMADSRNNAVDMASLVVRSDKGSKTLYVAQDCDIAVWTFHSVSKNVYTLSTDVGGTEKYLKFSGDRLLLDDDAQNAEHLSLETDGRSITLSSKGMSISFDGADFSVKPTNSADTSRRLYLTKLSGLENDDYVCYSADKISVSDVTDSSMIILYTRVWNDKEKRYDFYAVDHDGTLYPCYERGDSIMWVGSRINTMQWKFIEYTYSDGSPKYYYELYNPYSKKYIAPQIKDGQVLSDSKIGINMPGRRLGEYYTDILAWDDPCYAYAGLGSSEENRNIISVPRSKAETYYFAVVEKPVTDLTKIQTIDNTEYGITMKMIDFPKSDVQNTALGTVDTTSKDHSTKGLLSSRLEDNGYPTATETGESFSVLYNGANSVNHLFTESIYRESGYFEFDSCQNFATLFNEQGELTSEFTVYKELGTTDITKKSTLKHGQFFPYDTITAGIYSTENPENLYGAVAVPEYPEIGILPESDPRKYEKLYTVGKNPNYYNGMEMEAKFIQTPGGKDAWGHDIIFEFTGDDDFWLYVDGELIIDLGGIHSALAGNVNFATGDVVVEKNHTNLREIFRLNYQERNPSASSDEVNAYLAEHFRDGENIFRDYSTHTMKLFYMERGAGASNLHMRFNLSNSAPTKVMLTKKVTGSDDIDFNLVEYPFQIWYKDRQLGEPKLLANTDTVSNVRYQNSTRTIEHLSEYTPPDSNVSYNSVYFINPDMSTEINFPEKTIEYRIVECGISSDVYDHVYVNGTEVAGSSAGGTNRKAFDSGWKNIVDVQTMVFENHVASDALRTLSFKKVLYDCFGSELKEEQDSTVFNFRLSLSKNSDNVLSPANMYKYHVTNPKGFLCRWDTDSQKFVSTGTEFSDISSLTERQKEQVTFDTSMNGAISKIPAGYTVHVPNLPVGTKFMVTEINNEIPVGYKLLSYERVGDTYFVAQGDTENIGLIREEDSPFMLIKNQRGWGIEARKIWSDSSDVSEHDPIYTAVYTGEELVDGTVRKITHPNSSVRYYFDTLKDGADFSDYSVYEVRVKNPVLAPDNETVLSYSNIKRLKDGDTVKIGNISKNNGISDISSYIVGYSSGEVNGSSKTVTITNVRTGGIVITLYDMNTNEPLANGIFTLKQGDNELGTFTSDSDGRVTVMYDFLHDTDYMLTEITPPAGYIGLPNTAVFSVGTDDSISLDGNGENWQSWHSPTNENDHITAYIDLFNKPYMLRVIKEDSLTHLPLKDVHFSLYHGIQGIGGFVKDITPVSGCEDMITDINGNVPLSDSVLSKGIYYLTEISSPENYKPLKTDIIFNISETGGFIINGSEGYFTADGTNEVIYSLHVPNTPLAELTVTKTVKGNFGNTVKDFSFTLTVEGASASDEYEWSKNGVPQSALLHSGGTFTLKHNDTCTIVLPRGKRVTLSENNENYKASFKLENASEENVNTKTFVLEDDTVLSVTNTLDGGIPTGIRMDMPVALMVFAGVLAGVLFILHRKRFHECDE